MGGAVYCSILAHFLLLWKQLGREREGGEGESKIWWGEGRGNEVPYNGKFSRFQTRKFLPTKIFC